MLKLSYDELCKLYLSLPVASCLISPSLHFIAANQRYADLMRVPLESIIGRTMYGLNPKEHIENVLHDFRILEAGGVILDHEISLWDGIYLVSVSAIRDTGKNSIVSISVTLTNITRHKDIIGRLSQEIDDIFKLSQTDSLTGLGNRRMFDSVLEREIKSVKHSSQVLSLLLIDVDKFKDYNDTYGHIKGDECLRLISDKIRASVRRKNNLVARFGGEEFVVILPNTYPKDAFRIAETVRKGISHMGIIHAKSIYSVITVSIGIGFIKNALNSDSLEITKKLLNHADSALYLAKRSGRNRVCVNN